MLTITTLAGTHHCFLCRLPGVQLQDADAGQQLVHELDPLVSLLEHHLPQVGQALDEEAGRRRREQEHGQPDEGGPFDLEPEQDQRRDEDGWRDEQLAEEGVEELRRHSKLSAMSMAYRQMISAFQHRLISLLPA